jgi:hypothetical protein
MCKMVKLGQIVFLIRIDVKFEIWYYHASSSFSLTSDLI